MTCDSMIEGGRILVKAQSGFRSGFYIALALVMLLAFLTLPFPGRSEAPPRNLTLMIYLCGSDLESNYGAATTELMEITQACADVLSFALFPQVAPKFLEKRDHPAPAEPAEDPNAVRELYVEDLGN